jgi:hypothetical protein
LGARTLKTGQSRWFVGYKKHTLRLWWREYRRGVLLIPLVSWVAPANVADGGLLLPSLHYCKQRWFWHPHIVVADMGYLSAEAKRYARQQWQVAVVTRIREGMKLVPPYVSDHQVACPQGQPLHWLGYQASDPLHWFGVPPESQLCPYCWEASACPQQFAYAPEAHETLLGLIPLASQPAQRLLQQVRPWIEPTQSYEKNQLGLSQVFLNSLRLAWCMSLLADAAVLLRSHALLHAPAHPHPLRELAPYQGLLDLGLENVPER